MKECIPTKRRVFIAGSFNLTGYMKNWNTTHGLGTASVTFTTVHEYEYIHLS